jgi:2-aminoethylphosphonate-pyruvate transaminase
MRKLLFTPGPLNTSAGVKNAMQTDVGSRDYNFIECVSYIRSELLSIAKTSKADGFECVIMQGSGTFGIEALISSVIPDKGHLLVIVNGAYGGRIVNIARLHKIKVTLIVTDEDEYPSVQMLRNALTDDKSISHVFAVHCETTTGILNPINDYGEVCRELKRYFFVDAMSSFGAVEIDLNTTRIDALVSSSNKCIEGVPGFSFVIIRQDILNQSKGNARTLSLDLFDQWYGLERNGQFRFTPPTHTLLAFRQALVELQEEGGVAARAERYKENHRILTKGMKSLGFREYLPADKQGYIITSFFYRKFEWFDFDKFYMLLNERGKVIYPGKLSKHFCFRIGNIGKIYPEDVRELLYDIEMVIHVMKT